MITHTINGLVRPRVAVSRDAMVDYRLDEAVAVRRCALYRSAFRGTAVSFPADALRFDAASTWIRERGVTVDVMSSDGLDRVRLAGIDPSHVVMHCGGAVSVSMRRGRFGRFVVDSENQIVSLADDVLGKQCVVVDATRSDELAAGALAHEELNLAGLHARIGITDEAGLADTVVAMIAKMARITRRHRVVLSCVSLGEVAVPGADGDPRALRRVAGIVEQAVEDGCIRYRYPRPAVTVAPDRTTLLRS